MAPAAAPAAIPPIDEPTVPPTIPVLDTADPISLDDRTATIDLPRQATTTDGSDAYLDQEVDPESPAEGDGDTDVESNIDDVAVVVHGDADVQRDKRDHGSTDAIRDTVAEPAPSRRRRFRRPAPAESPVLSTESGSAVGRSWSAVTVRDRASLAGTYRRGPGMKLTRRADRRLRREMRLVRDWASRTDSEFVVVHSGEPPAPAHVDELLTAINGTIDRGAAATTRGVFERPDMIVEDAGSNPLITNTWQRLVRNGVHAVTVGSPASPLERRPFLDGRASVRNSEAGPLFVVRTDVLRREAAVPPKKAYRRPTWWAATLVVIAFAISQIVRIVTGNTQAGSSAGLREERWLEAARQGSVDGLDGSVLPGSSLWPALARPVIEVAGVAGVRWLSLLLSVIAVIAASAAGSRLFGRWAARSTSAALAIGLLVSGVATSATPAPLAMAALAVSLLGVALVEGHDRRSWVLLAGLAATVAVVALYQALVFVFVLSWFFTLLRGKHGLTDSNTYRLVLVAGLLAWFLPTRDVSVRFIVASRAGIDWAGIGTNAAWLVGAIIVTTVVVTFGIANQMIRRRVLVLCSSLLAVPVAQLLSGSADSSVDLSMALVLVAPAVGGALAYAVAKWRFGHDVLPTVRTAPEILTVDPNTGKIRHRLIRYANRQVRLSAAAVVVASLWYLPWAVMNIDWRNWWIAVPFMLANTSMVLTALLSAFNNWNRATPIPIDVAKGHEPLVGVIVPTYSEPLHMVVNVVRSILDQDWPTERLRIVVSDDAHNDQVRNAFATMAAELPDGVLLYNRPPKKGDPARRGESKSGNLNSAILLLDDCDFVETRDADDLVGSPNFLRATVGQLMDDPGLGFIQTIKETMTSPGDPWNNNEPFFYRGTMLARNADYAIFPCGSGLVWRRAALKSIDEFPVWNLVEDLHSGVLGLREGWRGLYVPIVGAYAQHSPEDIGNVFKQRGTWALDTTRILVFDRFKGIPRKMRLHFIEQAMFYLLSFPLIVLVLVPAIGLVFDRFPLDTDPTTYAIHFWAFALSIELILLALAADQIAGSLWRSRLSWIGMAPIYAKSALRAVWFGPRRKPAYKVTRKTDAYMVYIRMVKSHWAMIVLTLIGIFIALFRDSFLTELDLGSLYWGIVAMVGLGGFLRLSWFGVDLRERALLRFARPIAFFWPKLSPVVLPIWRRFKPLPTDSRSRCDQSTVRLTRLLAARVQSPA